MVLRSPLFTPFLASAFATPTIPHGLSHSTITNSLAHQECPPTVRRNAPPLLELPKLPPASAYVHLPFCRKRCHYCDFPIIALGSSSSHRSDNNDPRISSYVDTLCREIMATTSSSSTPLETVFLGGGTPSLVPPHLVSSVLNTLSSKFGVRGDAEISMEMDPGTFTAKAMKELMSLGVNRVSLGVQSFQDELLKSCGRAHGVGEIYEALDIVKSCRVGNWSIDLISSLPHQTPTMWEESLQLAIGAEPTHVSVYDLQVEQGTKFGILYTPGEFPLPSENQSADFYKMASRMLREAGYEHYEISSYGKSGYLCKHNSTYWKSKAFYGFGLGSASYIGGVRFSRPRRLKEYTSYVQGLEDRVADHIHMQSDGDIETKDFAADVVMLSLRTSDGLDLKSFREAFGESMLLSILEVYKPYLESRLLICLDEQQRNIAADEIISRHEKAAYLRLSDPDGFLLSNELIALAFGAISP